MNDFPRNETAPALPLPKSVETQADNDDPIAASRGTMTKNEDIRCRAFYAVSKWLYHRMFEGPWSDFCMVPRDVAEQGIIDIFVGAALGGRLEAFRDGCNDAIEEVEKFSTVKPGAVYGSISMMAQEAIVERGLVEPVSGSWELVSGTLVVAGLVQDVTEIPDEIEVASAGEWTIEAKRLDGVCVEVEPEVSERTVPAWCGVGEPKVLNRIPRVSLVVAFFDLRLAESFAIDSYTERG